jgi:hypothetical protein
MLKDADIQKFREEGFLVAHQFFTPAQVDLLLENWQIAHAQIQAGEALERVDRFLRGSMPLAIATLYKDENLVAVARQVLQTNDIALYMNRILIKDARWNGSVATHQDLPYFHGGANKFVAFIPLQPHNEQTGGLKLVKGSHHYGNLGMRGTIQHEHFPELDTVAPALEVGDVLFMDFLTWHFSEAAQIPCDRPLMQIAYQSAADGSYFDLDAPTLVAGQWRTTHFLKLGEAIVQDVVLPGGNGQRPEEQEIARLKAELEQVTAQYQASLNQQHDLTAQMAQLESRLQAYQAELAAMASSKFWKLRNSWLHLKQRVRPGKSG